MVDGNLSGITSVCLWLKVERHKYFDKKQCTYLIKFYGRVFSGFLILHTEICMKNYFKVQKALNTLEKSLT